MARTRHHRRGICSNCGRERSLATAKLCSACYQFKRRTGRTRTPADIYLPRGIPLPICKRCRQQPATYGRKQALCKACGRYQRRHSRPRPRHHWAETCKICSRPKGNGDAFRHGRCRACSNYFNRHGVERPDHLIQKADPLGWCDCGFPAAQEREITIFSSTGKVIAETLLLCLSCAKLESE